MIFSVAGSKRIERPSLRESRLSADQYYRAHYPQRNIGNISDLALFVKIFSLPFPSGFPPSASSFTPPPPLPTAARQNFVEPFRLPAMVVDPG